MPKPEEGDRLTVTMEGEAAWTGQAVFVRNRQLGDVSHWEVFMSRV